MKRREKKISHSMERWANTRNRQVPERKYRLKLRGREPSSFIRVSVVSVVSPKGDSSLQGWYFYPSVLLPLGPRPEDKCGKWSN